jgi:hypothetical protein
MNASKQRDAARPNTTHNEPEMARDVAAPLGDATQAQLTFVRGASLVTIAAAPALRDLFQAHFEGPAPQVQVAGGAVTIQYPRLSLAEWARYALLWGRMATSIQLNTTLPWQIGIRGGVSKLSADLRALRLSGLTIVGGASEVTIDLPAPLGEVPIRVAGGASHITLRRPAGAAARVGVRSGASPRALDEQDFGAGGGTVRLATPGGERAADRYEIEVAGGASNLTVDTW